MKEFIQKISNNIKKIKEQGLKNLFLKNQNLIVVIFVTGLALLLRTWQIGSVPPGFSENEREMVNLLQRMDFNRLWLGGEFYHGGYLILAFFWTKIFGLTVLNLRILSAVIGTLTVLFSYIFISKWFSKKIAIFTSFLFAISSFHITISRLILPDILLPLVMLLLFSILTEAYRNKNIWYFGIAGFFVGLGLYASPAFLFIPVVFAISGTYFYLKNKKFVTSYKEEVLIAAIGFLASSLPFWITFIREPMIYLTHFGFNRSIWQIVMNIGQIPGLLFSGTPKNYFLNIGSEPLLDPFIFITSVLGFLFALFSIQRRKYFFMITWLTFFALYAALKRGVQIVDLIGILPVLYAFSALILDYVLEKWFTTFPYNKNARLLVVTIISVFFALTTLYNYERYFVAYSNSKSVLIEFSAKPPIPLK